MFKIYKGLLSSYFSAMFSLNENNHPYATRHANDFHITAHRTPSVKNTIRIAGPVLWNSLDGKLRSSNSIHRFKRNIEMYCWLNSFTVYA